MEMICPKNCYVESNNYNVLMESLPLTIYNETHFHSETIPRRKNTLHKYCHIYLNDRILLFTIEDQHWRSGEFLQEFYNLENLRKKYKNHQLECERLFILYCKDSLKLLEEDNFYIVHLMENPWNHNSMDECLNDFIHAYNIFYRSTLTKSQYFNGLSSLEKDWKKNYLNISDGYQ